MGKAFSILKDISIIIFKLVLCLTFTLFIGIGAGIVFVAKFNWQIVLYLILFISVIVGFWIATFIKVKTIKVIYLVLFSIIYHFYPCLYIITFCKVSI